MNGSPSTDPCQRPSKADLNPRLALLWSCCVHYKSLQTASFGKRHCAHLPKGDGHSLVTWGREEHCMEGNLGNSALHPGLVPAECRLRNCFCLGKENKPYLGVETCWETQSCQSHSGSPACLQPVPAEIQPICQCLTPYTLLCKSDQRVVRNLAQNPSHILPYFTPNNTSDRLHSLSPRSTPRLVLRNSCSSPLFPFQVFVNTSVLD